MPRARASVSGLRTDNGENRGNPNGCKFWKTCWWNADDDMVKYNTQAMTWQQRQITGGHLAHRIRGVTLGIYICWSLWRTWNAHTKAKWSNVTPQDQCARCHPIFAVVAMSFTCVYHLSMSSSTLYLHVFQNLHPSGFPRFSPLSVLSPTTLARARGTSNIIL